MLLTTIEKRFLDVFVHEATHSPFTGPATKLLHSIGVEYGDISHVAWAYEQDVPRTSFELGHSAAISPPLPWPNRNAALERDPDLQKRWEDKRELAETVSPKPKRGLRQDDSLHPRLRSCASG